MYSLAESPMNIKQRLRFFEIALLFSVSVVSPLGAESWTVGNEVYKEVAVRDVNPETVVILHQGGLSSLPLKTLPKDLQEHFGYDPDKANTYREAQAQRAEAAQKRLKALKDARKAQTKPQQRLQKGKLDEVLSQLDQPLKVAERVDLRERFSEHELHPRNQGRRPSCSVFAVASAFGFALAENGKSGAISEEYLLWSTVQYLRRHPAQIQGRDFDGEEPGDIGFSLMSVVQAAQWYGAALQEEMPNVLGGSYSKIEAPSEELVERSRSRRLLRAARLGGRDTEQQVDFIIKVLNAGWPVTIGTRWPSAYTLRRSALVDAQTPLPDYSHAVTLVGYMAPKGNLQDCVFVFRNSWGVRWGMAGHGLISRNYLLEHILDAIVIDVEPGA
jgi:hypothetical protein